MKLQQAGFSILILTVVSLSMTPILYSQAITPNVQTRSYVQPPTLSWIPDYPVDKKNKTEIKASAPVLSVKETRNETSSFYGEAAASSHFATYLTGNKFEFMDTFVLPNPLQLNYIKGGTDLSDNYYGEIDLNNPGSSDHSFFGQLRDVARMDLSALVDKSSWYSNGQSLLGTREESHFGGNFRGLEQPYLSAYMGTIKENGETDTGTRDNKFEKMWLAFFNSSTTFTFKGIASSDKFTNYEDSMDGLATFNLQLIADKLIGGKNHIEMAVSHDRISKDYTTENLVNTNVSVLAMAYGPLNIDDLKIKGKIRYKDRPSSFIETSDVKNMFETDLSFTYRLGAGVFAGGMNKKDLNTQRLTRTTIEDLIATPPNYHPMVSAIKINDSPSNSINWLKASINGGRNYKFTAMREVDTLNNPSPTDFVQSGSLALATNKKERQKLKLVIKPRSEFNITLSHNFENRFFNTIDRLINDKSRLKTNKVLCNFPPIGGFSGSIDTASTSLTHADDDGGFTDRDELLSTGLHGGYAINRSWSIFADHLLMKSKGTNESREEFTTFGVAYDSNSSDSLFFEIAFGRDKFSDYEDNSKNFYGKNISLSTKASF